MTQITTDEIVKWTDRHGPVALHFAEHLMPVEGHGQPIFPATYAGIGYNIDTLTDGTQVASIDSVGSQANRIEPLFQHDPDKGLPELAELVPQIDITYGNQKTLSILEAGHRLGDAVIRCTELAEPAQNAFRALLDRADATEIARLAPTSLVFGAWDSRDTGAKLPRLVQSVIRAWDVAPLTRSAQYTPALDYAALDVFSEDDKEKAEGKAGSQLAERGYVHVPSTAQHGGIVASGSIRRDVTVNMVALRRLKGEDTAKLQSYVLGLSLIAALADQDGFLRAGCLLCADPDKPVETTLVWRNGTRQAVTLSFETVLDFARQQAKAFGVAAPKRVVFDKALAKADANKKK